MNVYAVRGGFYIALSLLFFLDATLMILAGLVLLCCGTMYIFAHINRVSDAADASAVHSRCTTRADYQSVPAKGFGTF